jgi:hypothetical protein
MSEPADHQRRADERGYCQQIQMLTHGSSSGPTALFAEADAKAYPSLMPQGGVMTEMTFGKR